MKCTETEEEEVTKGKENQLQLSCFINQEVKYLFTGLKLVSNCSGSDSSTDCSYTLPFYHTFLSVAVLSLGILKEMCSLVWMYWTCVSAFVPISVLRHIMCYKLFLAFCLVLFSPPFPTLYICIIQYFSVPLCANKAPHCVQIKHSLLGLLKTVFCGPLCVLFW